MQDSIILEARHLVKQYKQRSGSFGFGQTTINALDDVSVALKKGSTLAVVGESGSGKSTLARCLLQLHPFDSGEVLFQGQSLAKLIVKLYVKRVKTYKWCFKILSLR